MQCPFESVPLILMIELATALQNESDRPIHYFLNSENSKLDDEMRSISDCDLNVIGDVSTTNFDQLLIPNYLHKDVFNIFHSFSHPGVRATRDLISKCFAYGLA